MEFLTNFRITFEMTRTIPFAIISILIFMSACVTARNQPRVIVVTATPSSNVRNPVSSPTPWVIVATPVPTQVLPTLALSPVPEEQSFNPTPDPERPTPEYIPEHIVQPGETLTIIGQRYNVSVDTILSLNELVNPDILTIGQSLTLPLPPVEQTSNNKILPDSRIVYGPDSNEFNIEEFINQQPGFIHTVTDEVETRQSNGFPLKQVLNASQIIRRVALEYSIDPRLLLMLLEYKVQWLSNPTIAEGLQSYPFITPFASGGIDRAGMYKQLVWAANEINRGYYSWKFRDLSVLDFGNNNRFLYAPGLNAGTVALQYFFSINSNVDSWQQHIAPEGFYRLYASYFGDPFENAFDPLVNTGLEQPDLTLPFAQNEIWLFTGGSHGGWGGGSAWSALDFAPPDERPPGSAFCYTSEYWVRAVAPGIIARNENGTVVLDLDNDGDEGTGWTILYLHLDARDTLAIGEQMNTGDPVGQASCYGGFSSATHLHIARKYNGEWIPADCPQCLPFHSRPPFVMSNWRTILLPGQEYQGYMRNGNQQVTAEQGRETTINQISW